MHQVVVFLIVITGLVFISSQLILGQSSHSNTENKIKVPSHLDIESKSTQQEMAAIKNETSNSTNATGQVSSNTNSTNYPNQSLKETTNGNISSSLILANNSANF